MSNRRILFYCDEYPPAQTGGIGSVTKIVAEGLAQRGWQVAVAGSYEYGTGLPPVSACNGVEIYRFEYYRFLGFVPRPLRKAVKSLFRKTGLLGVLAAKALRENERKMQVLSQHLEVKVVELIDYIRLLQEIKYPVQLQRFAVPSTLRIHGSVSFLNMNKGISQDAQLWNDRQNFARASRMTAVSEYSKTFVNERLLMQRRVIDVIHNPIEDRMLCETPPKKRGKTVLFYGKIIPTKGAFQVLKAFQAIADEFDDWTLVLVGGGDIETAQRMVDPRLRDRIVFTGYVDRTQVIHAIDEAAFVVVPSYFENFSMVPLEVMARQTALIYTERTSGKEIIADGVNGLLVDPDDLGALQQKLIRLMNDEMLRDRLAQAGLNTVRSKFTLSVILDQLEQHYCALIGESFEQTSPIAMPSEEAALSH